VLGIWLAIYVDGYELWDGWILAAIVLWAIYGAAGTRSGRLIARARERAETGSNAMAVPRVLALRVVVFAAIFLLLLDMIYKPGA
jgi:drug/metabolite transporter (DMT)-like permease